MNSLPRIAVAGCTLAWGLVAPAAGKVFNLAAYGAVNDPAVSSADAFHRAIAACQAAGGGVVEVPAGRYLTGPIDLVSNMTLQVDQGAVVLFETGREHYPDITSRWEGLTEKGPHPLLFAEGCHHIAITGPGTFDGQGAAWWKDMDMAEHGNARPDRPIRRRPPLVQIKDCDDVRIDGPTFTNAPFWTVHLLYSEHIDVGHCRMINPPDSPNTDALNVDSCRHVVVHDCFADVGDDGFGIKSGRDAEGRAVGRPTEDVTFLRCRVAHGHSVCAIGSEESGGVRHIRFLDCEGDGTDNGIRLKSTRGRGGIVEDVVASHITLKNVGTAIVLSLHYTPTPPEPFSVRTPVFRDIRLDHVTAVNVRKCATIEGLAESPIADVTLSDLDLSGTTGITCIHARNLTFSHVTVAVQRAPFAEEDCTDVRRIDWKESLAAPAASPVVPLWPAGAPGSEARKDEPERIIGQNVSNVHFPTLTVFPPPADRNTGCAVIVCPGGGHRDLVMDKEGYTIARWLAAHGIAGFVLKYRLARDAATPPGTPQPYTVERDALADAQRAIRLVRRRAAEWGVNPAHVGIIGFSAGGELAALAAMRPGAGDPNAADPVDRIDARPDFQGLIYPGEAQNIAPQKGAPPAFLACGANDRPGIAEELPKVYLRFKAAGVPVELHIYAGVGHGFGLRPGPAHGWAEQFRAWLANAKFLAPARP
jgi:polygalacturonase/dienelactone hydrolase